MTLSSFDPTFSNVRRRPEALEFLERLHVTREMNQALALIQDTQATTGSELARARLLIAVPGVGKTRLVKYYQALAMEACASDSCTPVIYVELDAGASIGDIYKSILEAIGDPRPSGRSLGDLRDRIANYVERLGIELFIIDEAQTSLPSSTGAQLQKISDAYRRLMDRTKVPVLLVGTPDILRLLTATSNNLKKQDQFSQRSDHYIQLVAPMYGEPAWKTIMLGYHQMLGKAGVECVSLTNEDMLKRFYVATKGYRRLITAILDKAIKICDPPKPIDTDVLAAAYKEAMVTCEYDDNPFLCGGRELTRMLSSANAQRRVDDELYATVIPGHAGGTL